MRAPDEDGPDNSVMIAISRCVQGVASPIISMRREGGNIRWHRSHGRSNLVLKFLEEALRKGITLADKWINDIDQTVRELVARF